MSLKVVLHARNLGAHFDSTRRGWGVTLTQRLAHATAILGTLDTLGVDALRKARLCDMAVLPKGLYGCEATPVNDLSLANFRARLAKVLHARPHPHGRSPAMVFLVRTPVGREDLDPDLRIFTLRMHMLRRQLLLWPEAPDMVRGILQVYRDMGVSRHLFGWVL